MQKTPDSSKDQIDAALQRLSQSQETDHRFVVINTYSWVAALGLIFIVTVGTAWAFLGEITSTIEGNGIAHVAENKDLVIYGFIPLEKSQNVHTGLKVRMDFSNVHLKNFGQLKGHVSKTNYFPIKEAELSTILPDAAIRAKVLQEIDQPVLVEIVPDYHEQTKALEWTTKKDASSADIPNGARGKIKIILDSVKPYTFIYPIHDGERG